ncbi:lipid IV(A) palmitoyltransferase PagP [Georgfuchsia toluolica]|nr:lipid IV(A) palmitoyltransferase PagP [Georgfuchsia toluolica]
MKSGVFIKAQEMITHIIFRTVTRLLAMYLVTAMVTGPAFADEPATSSWYDKAVQRLEATWKDGRTELYVPLHVYHVRSSYTREKINSFNETPWGLGIGKGAYDQDGDWHGVYVMEFKDSHSMPEYLGGYGYKTFWPLHDELKFGLGYAAFITARADIGHYTPIPGVLPMASLEYQRYSLDTIYLPGGHGRGNIFIFWGKVRF